MAKNQANPDSEIARFVRAARMALKLTQEQFGDKFNRTKANANAWELGRHEPAFAVLKAMSYESGVPLPASIKPDIQEPDAQSDLSNSLGHHGAPLPRSTKQPIELKNNPDYPAIRRVHLKANAGVSGYSVDYADENDGPPIVFRADWYKSKNRLKRKRVPFSTQPAQAGFFTPGGNSSFVLYSFA